ncbi:MAG: hypothetical protein WKF83_04685 [Nocardioidaceae bacterium]
MRRLWPPGRQGSPVWSGSGEPAERNDHHQDRQERRRDEDELEAVPPGVRGSRQACCLAAITITSRVPAELLERGLRRLLHLDVAARQVEVPPTSTVARPVETLIVGVTPDVVQHPDLGRVLARDLAAWGSKVAGSESLPARRRQDTPSRAAASATLRPKYRRLI